MIRGLYLSSRALQSKSKNIDSVAGNLANINTTGYKRQLPFSEVLLNSGEVKIKQYTDHNQGEVVSTGNPLDLALSGQGYFAVKTNNGTEYTRNGKFKVSEDGFLVNEQGSKVLGENGEINILENTTRDNQNIQIDTNGEIKIGSEVIDKLLIVKMNDEQDVARTTGLNFATDELNVSPLEEGKYQVSQGYLEESNVNPIVEMESMIRTNSEYESAQKMMKYLDQTLGQANEIGKVAG